ncbi:hypothetical protein ScPMuIL_002224, partial [Solemya velum]
CDLCESAFSKKSTLKTHKRVHSGEKPYKCDLCESAFSEKSNLKKHKRVHTGVKPYECDLCESAFSKKSTLNNHKRVHSGEKPYKCGLCESAFSYNTLRKHKRIHTGEKPFKCDLCETAFSKISNLTNHKRVHTGEKPFKCDFCEAAFSQKGNLSTHKRVHTGEKPFKCGLCEAAFSVEGNLTNHKRVHTGEKPYKCDLCEAAFSQTSHLKDHQRVHTGEKPYECDLCESAFSDKSTLRRHRKVHTGEKPYECELCESAFSDTSTLRRHRKMHTGEKPYECDLCESAFSDKGALKKHEKVHTGEKPFKCSLCESAFSRKDTLKNHIRVHTGEKPFKCDLCESAFSEKSNLKIHRRVHTGEKPFKCDLCEAAFSQNGSLKNHERVHTGEKPYSMSEDRLRLSRRRQLTPAAQKMYTDFVIKHTDFLKRLQDRLETLNTQVSSYEGDPVQLQGQIETAFHDYERASSEFFNFLTSQRTEESDREKFAHTITFDSVKVKVKELLSELRKRVSPVKPKSSRPSSVKSRATSTSSVGSQQRARLKLEKAKLRQKYIDEECELAKRRTEIESDEKKLETKRDVEEAEIEVSILDEPSDGRSESQVDSKLTQQRVESFVHEQNEYQQVEQQTQAFSVWTEAEQASQIPPTTYEPMFSSWSPFPAASNPWPMPTMVSQHTYGVPVHTSNNFNPGFPSNSDTLPSNLYTSTHTVGSQIPTPGVTLVSVPQIAPVYSQQTITSTSVCSSPTTPSMLYTSVQSSVPHNVSTVNSVFMSPIASTQAQNSFNISGSPQLTTQSVPVPQRVELLACQEMSKFLMKKDLLKSRLTKFDDRPEFFESWKRTFKDVVRGSELSSLEEIELAQIWLGPQSTTYAKNIQSATLDPKVACKKLWERLEERYGRPEVIEAAVKRKLSQFPKLTNKDYSKLYDLTDIVAEIQSIKSNPRLALQFSYFDSSSGVNQIVQKLPYSIQEKWTTHADKYKCANDCSYPPFDIFANFLHNIARLKNDPSFMYEVNTTQSSKTFTSKNVSTSRSTVVKVEKTDISPTCPVHGTNHSLNMCRSFRKKSINERKDFIKKNNICFKCCGPEKHFAKDCNRTISCVLCKSSKHPTALHIDKSQETFSKSLPSKPVNRMDSDHTSEETTVRCSPVDSDNNNRKPFKCDLCEAAFSRKSKLKVYKRVHTGEKPYKCSLCESAFSRKDTLKNHIRVHTGEKPFKGEPYECDLCESAFSDKTSLGTHKRVHTREKPYTCDLCEAAFSIKGNLTRHKRVHTGEKPYE